MEEVDGADPACVEERGALWALSGVKAKYPQFFLEVRFRVCLCLCLCLCACVRLGRPDNDEDDDGAAPSPSALT